MNILILQKERKLNQYRRLLRQTPGLLEVSERAYARALAEETGKQQDGFPVRDGFSAQDSFHTQAAVSMLVLGPALLSFLLWIFEEAKKAGRYRLYFLARDGYPMYRLAERLCRMHGLPFDCRYLYASRLAFRLPEQHLIGDAFLERICRGGMDVTFAAMMGRAGLTPREAEQIAAQVCPRHKPEDVLSWKEIQKLREPLSRCRAFRELAAQRSKECLSSAVAYFRQEGLLDEVPYALVDSGWIGTMQESLCHLLESAGYRGRAEGYYFGLYSLPAAADRTGFHGFYFEPERGIRRKAHFSNCLFECVFTAPHGMTLGYENRDGRWKPRLAPVSSDQEKRVRRQLWFLGLYAEAAAGAYGDSLRREAGRLRLESLLTAFMSKPSLEESACYGSFSFSDDVTEDRMQPLAARLTGRQLLDHHLLFRLRLMLLPGKRRLKDSGWIEGSIRLYGGRLYAWHRAGALLYKYASGIRMQNGFRKGRKAA